MTRRESRTLELALAILRRSLSNYGASCRSVGLQLALRVLLPYVDRHTLVSFRTIADSPNPSQRRHNLNATLHSIESSVRRADALQAIPNERR